MNANKDEKRPKKVLENYNNRFTTLKKARIYASNNDVVKALEHYQLYLNAISKRLYLENTEKLSPQHFDSNKDLGELLMISQTYWDMAKLFDRAKNLNGELEKSLDKFVMFSKDFKFQRINAQMMKRYINKKIPHNPKIFQNYYQKIHMESGLCFLATHAYSSNDQKLETFYKIRETLGKSSLGFFFIEHYYQFSPLLVQFFKRYPLFDFLIFKLFIRPFLNMTYKIAKISLK